MRLRVIWSEQKEVCRTSGYGGHVERRISHYSATVTINSTKNSLISNENSYQGVDVDMVKTKTGKLGGEKGKLTKQPKLTDFHVRGETQKTTEVMEDEGASGGEAEDGGTNAVLAAINSMKAEFSSRFDGVMTALENVRKEVSDCAERVSQAELRISSAEDDVASLRTKLHTLEAKHKTLEDKVLDLEARSRRNNLRLVGLPEGAEGRDPCSFLEKWIPEALNKVALQSSVVLERAHRIGPLRDNKTPPRTLIMKFLNYKDKLAVTEAARAKKEIKYKDQQVRFYPDLAEGIQKMRKQFDPIRKELRNLGIRHGLIHPARLLITYEGKTCTLKTPQEAQDFIQEIRKDTSGSI